MQSNSVRRIVVALGAAAVLTGAAVLVSASSGTTSKTKPTAVPALFRGIPEDDGVLGDPSAPVTITEFVDLQCPICAQASHELLPMLIDEYVRPGKVKLAARTLHFLGPDSERAARAAAAAQRQGRLWPFLHAFYSAQGPENSGYVTGDFLRSVARAAGADPEAALEEAESERADAALAAANADASTYGVQATPTFLIGSDDGPSATLGSGVPDAADLREAIDAELKR